MNAAGDIRRFDTQSDIFRGEYKLVEETAPGVWVVEHLAPSEEIQQAVLDYYLSGSAYLGYTDPFGPGRRQATADEAFDREIAERNERAGTRTTIRFVSHSEWAKHF